ncbi:hypothetical protein KAX35_08720 [candidate division WOR-3 bacterium]|nr:hypothetical protein [candidate division WOR-3 bacterium]
MFGLSPLGDIAKSTSIVFAAFGFVTISWILGVVSTLGGWKRAFRILGIRLLLIAYMISAPIGIVIALEPAHSKIIQTKIITLKSISNKIIQNSKSISSAMNTTKFSQTKIDSCWAARNSLKNLYESVSQVPNWPLRLSNLLNILSNLFIPYLILVLFEWLKSKLKQ